MKTKRKLIISVLLIAISLFAGTSGHTTAQSGSIKWYGYDEGLARGKEEGKKIFMFFWADWCKFCEKMESDTLSRPKIIKYLNDNFVSVKVNSDLEKTLASRYFVRGLPTVWFLGEKGEQIVFHPGFVSSDVFLPYLRYIQSDKYKNMSFQDFLKDSAG